MLHLIRPRSPWTVLSWINLSRVFSGVWVKMGQHQIYRKSGWLWMNVGCIYFFNIFQYLSISFNIFQYLSIVRNLGTALEAPFWPTPNSVQIRRCQPLVIHGAWDSQQPKPAGPLSTLRPGGPGSMYPVVCYIKPWIFTVYLSQMLHVSYIYVYLPLFTYKTDQNWVILRVNVDTYSIHGAYGY